MNELISRIIRRTLTVAAVASLGLAACGSDDAADQPDGTASGSDETQVAPVGEGIAMTDAWSRQPAEGQTSSAVYGVLTNDSSETITAVSATTSVTDQVELHEVITDDDGEMSMQEKEGGYEIAAGESLVFEPGGPHIMLLDVDPATYPDSVEVTLSFDDDTSIEFSAEVRALDDAMSDMDDMDETEGTGDSDDGEMEEMDDGEMEQAPSTDG